MVVGEEVSKREGSALAVIACLRWRDKTQRETIRGQNIIPSKWLPQAV